MNTIDKHWQDYEVQNPDGSWTTVGEVLKAREQRIATEARIDEMERLNIYYLRHDGEGEHQLAAQFDVRIAQLKNNPTPDERKGGDDGS